MCDLVFSVETLFHFLNCYQHLEISPEVSRETAIPVHHKYFRKDFHMLIAVHRPCIVSASCTRSHTATTKQKIRISKFEEK